MSKGKLTTEQRQKQIMSRLKNENARLRLEMAAGFKERDEKIVDLEYKLEKALLLIEELQKYVFRGKKKKNKDDEDNDNIGKDGDNGGGTDGHKKRDKSSYRRPVPQENDITAEEIHDIKNCPDCGAPLTKLKLLEFYEEDILPIKEWFTKLKSVKRIKIMTGYCPKCKKRVSAIPIPKQKVSIGENIKQLIAFQATVLQLSNSQIIDFIESHLRFKIANGEIAHILSQQARKLKPAFTDLVKNIREGPGTHMDETGYNVAFGDEYSGNYAWAMTSIMPDNNDTVFILGKNRGKGNALELIGEDYQGYGVTDDYPGYTNIFRERKHALCWAHPKRKFKDLKNSGSLSKEKKEACRIFYGEFMEIYGRVLAINKSDFKKREREKASEQLIHELKEILKPGANDPAKLKTLKETMLKKMERYFVCVTEPGIPMTNNKAERALRHLVIKRKKSFGSKTPKGAQVMSILYSVIMSLWWRSKKNFFQSYAEALG